MFRMLRCEAIVRPEAMFSVGVGSGICTWYCVPVLPSTCVFAALVQYLFVNQLVPSVKTSVKIPLVLKVSLMRSTMCQLVYRMSAHYEQIAGLGRMLKVTPCVAVSVAT